MRPGDVVANRFQIEAIAGTGGMGTVYRALDLAAGERVALKTLAGIGERDAARFAREAAVLAELTHPGIVRYVAHGLTAAHEHYIAMEWLEGETLHDRLARGALPLPDALALARAAAEAIAAAHQRGIVHRDIKPMNLFLVGGDPARVKVLDFGIARHVQHAGLLTHTGAVIGTPGYMAPEQVRGETAIDARTDVFSLGCVLYRCLTGRSAFGGDQSLAVLAKILVEDVQPPSEIEPRIPPALDDLVLRMLAKDPAGRPVGGRAVAGALARIGSAAGAADAAGAAAAAGAAGAAGEPGAAAAQRPAAAGGADPTLRAAGAAGGGREDGTVSTGGRAAITEAEQRLVSIVLSGPLPDGSLPDPAQLAATAAAFGGRLEHLTDGASLVLFAHEDVATDHAARAARCALALQGALPGAALVVASGRTSVGRTLVGEVLDRAAAALAGLASGQIAVDPATAGLLDPRFILVERGARRLLGGLRDAQEPVRTLLGRATPLVGRDRELGNLESLWIECADEQVARAALVTAPPGGGKSRLRQELVRRILQRDERAELLVGHADSLRAGSPFALVTDAIRRACGVREGDSLESQRAALRARLERHVDADAVDRVAHLLGELIGAPFPTGASELLRAARTDPVVKSDAMRQAFTDWLAAECRHHPVLLVLEDLHWGDRATVELVDAALRELAQLPFMVLALARPEVHDTFPRLWADRAVQELRLPQLTRKAGERLARELLGGEIDTGVIARIVERADGNAFFLEELIRAVAEGRGDALPDSVLSMLQLRLDALGGDGKRVLRAASVFGERFWRGGVAELLGGDPRAALEPLELLVRRELIAPAPEARLPGEVEYAFRHDLVREAAYATMSAEDRALAHRLAGAWLVAHGFADAVALAGHFSRGEQPELALEQYARAAAQALAASDFPAALAHAERGLTCRPGPLAAGELELIRAEALSSRGDHALGLAAAERARAAFPPGSAPWFLACDEVFFSGTRIGDMHRAVRALHEASAATAEPDAAVHQVRSIARAAIMMLRFGPPGIGPVLAQRAEELAAPVRARLDLSSEQRLLSMRGFAARIRGDVTACLAAFEDALRVAEAAHNLRETAFSCLSLAGCYHELGADELAIPFARRGIALAERIGALTVAPLLAVTLALCELELGQIAEARATARAALARHAGRDTISTGLTHWVLARAALVAGDLDEAERELDGASALLLAFSEWHAIALATRALVHVARGELAEARSVVDRAVLLMRVQAGFEEGEALIRLTEIEILEAAGDLPAAHHAAALAIARLEARAGGLAEPWRTRFLARAVHAQTLARRARAAL